MPLIPAIAVIDSRNLIGQADTFSLPERNFTCAGIADALEDFGFDVTQFHVGVAFSPSSSPRSAIGRIHAENTNFANALRAEGAHIIEGELHQRGPEVVEKMVDVGCALKVAELAHGALPGQNEVILLFSRDLDLLPAAQYGTRVGQRTYMVSTDANYHRNAHRVLVPKASYQMLTDSPVDEPDDASLIAAYLVGDPGPEDWTVVTPLRVQGQDGHVVELPSGVRGFMADDPHDVVGPGDVRTLAAADVVFDGQRPMVYCTREAEFDFDRPWLVATTVDRRRDARWVEVLIDGKPFKSRCPVGVAERDHNVLVRVKHPGGPVPHQANVRLVGPLQQPTFATRAAGCLAIGRPTPVQVETIRDNRTVVGRTTDGTRVRLLRTFAVRPVVGQWYVASATATTGGASRSGQLLEMVSTALPADPS